MSKIIGVAVNSEEHRQELNYMVVAWNGESTKDYSHIQCKIMTSSGIYVNTVTKAITSSVSKLPLYLLQDGIKPNTKYKLELTGMKDSEEVADSTSDEVTFTTPASIGQVNGTVFNLYDSSSDPKEQGYRNNFLFNVGFAPVSNVFLLENHLEYKMTIQNKTTKEIKTIDVRNGAFYSLYNIFNGAITAGEYKFEFFYRIRVGANIYDSAKQSTTSTYEADTRPSLKPQSFSITVNETYRQQCNIKLVYDDEVASNSFNKLLKVYKGSVLKFTKIISNTDSFFPHDGQYNLDGNNTYTAIVETSRTITDHGITETAVSNQTTFFLSEWRAPAAPAGLYIDTNKVLHWGAIENATSYMVKILGNNYSTEKNFYDLKQTALKDYIGQVNITVAANNDAGVATSAPCVYINRPIPITGIRVSNLDRTSKQITFSWNPQIQYSYTIIYRLYINNTLIADNLTNTSYTFDYNNYFKDGGRYVIAVDSLVNGVGSQPVSSFTYTYKEIEVEKDAIKKAKIKINETTTTPEYPISVNAENVIVEYNDGTHENVQVVLEDKAERSLYQDDKIDLGGSSSKQHGVYSASIGTETLASGSNSIAVGDAAHAEGLNSSSFGNGTYAIAESSHVEGQGTSTTEDAKYAHAEGWATKARGIATHVEGYNNSAMTDYSHAEGTETVTSGIASHAEGIRTVSDGEGSHAEGYWTAAYGLHSHAEGESILNASGTGYANILKAEGRASHAEGRATIASGDYSHAEGSAGTITGMGPHGHYDAIVGTTASGESSHAEGIGSIASGIGAHAEGIIDTFTSSSKQTIASGTGAHAEGGATQADGKCSHAEGGQTTTTGKYSHAEGWYGLASGDYAHVEGAGKILSSNLGPSTYIPNTASGEASHAEGRAVTASGNYSHVGGYRSQALGACSFAHGNQAIAYREGAIILGSYPSANNSTIFAIGNGTSNNSANILEITPTTTKIDTSLKVSGKHGDINTENLVSHYYSTTLGASEIISGKISTHYERSYMSGVSVTTDEKDTFYVNAEDGVIHAASTSITKTDYAEYIYPWYDNNINNEDRTGYFVTFKNNLLYKANKNDNIIGITSETYGILGTPDALNEWTGKYQKDELGRMIKDIDNTLRISDEYDIALKDEYIPRTKRKEWSAVGLIGQLYIRDDGTCKAGEYCKCADGGIATLAEKQDFNTWLVLERISNNTIKILFK